MFPSIPVDTVRAARALYGRGNLYLRLGDRLNHLVSKFNPAIFSSDLDDRQAAFFMLLTIIQYVEKLTDAELADAIQRRMDLRYALHLATPNNRLDPHSLCLFRNRVFTDSQYRVLFAEMFKHIYPEIMPTAMDDASDVDHILWTICENEVRATLMDAMLSCMEALSANHYTWLLGIALPHWYQRYNRSLIVTNPGDPTRKQEPNEDDIKRDIQHLLQEIRASDSRDIMEMPETQKLNYIWGQLTGPISMKNCNYCINHLD